MLVTQFISALDLQSILMIFHIYQLQSKALILLVLSLPSCYMFMFFHGLKHFLVGGKLKPKHTHFSLLLYSVVYWQMEVWIEMKAKLRGCEGEKSFNEEVLRQMLFQWIHRKMLTGASYG